MTIQELVSDIYFKPFFGEDHIANDGWRGVAKSGVNVAFWSAGVGAVAHLLGAKNAVHIAGVTFVALVAGEVIFGLSGTSTNENHLRFMASTAPGTNFNAPPASEASGFDLGDGHIADNGFGETDNFS